ncbi:Dipeptide ABC transporter permease DppC [Helicobacter sp. NHP19-012]|uniref:Dipeptide ABC transporter permease DppC n=1 Tax=Helicobacter gastrofelis TaxID=2849642 RepID=A0ABM7SQ17_9HELI|nr:ABC transporter permease [Helicobacter sp. NHP19-012]BCZ19757.1 Dipeptide ABC transporter permease DppC [Helicobacter sp. NHP19-012]
MERFKAFWENFKQNKAGLVGLFLLMVLVFCALFAPMLAPYDPTLQDAKMRLVVPFFVEGGSGAHWLGTDDLGRDILSRLLYGARISLTIGVVAVGIAVFFGVIFGLVAGYFGGLIDMLTMRFMDLMLSLPSILLIIIVVAILGPSLTNAMLAIGIVGVPGFARIVRASVLAEKQKEYTQASKLNGSSHGRLMFVVILPNCTAPLVVQATMGFAGAVLEAAGLSFLGLGAQPPSPEWGAMLMDALQFITTSPWTLVFPGCMIFLTVMGFNLVGDAIMDALDPKRS